MKRITIFLILIILAAAFTWGCQTKAPQKSLAEICREKFPPKDSIQIFEVEVQVETPPDTQEVYVEMPCNDSIVDSIIRVPCPPRVVFVKKMIKTKSEINTALVAAYDSLSKLHKSEMERLRALEKEAKKKPKQRTNPFIWALVAILALSVLIAVIKR